MTTSHSAPRYRDSPILHLYTGAMMTDLAVEQYHLVYPEHNGSALTQPGWEVSSKVSHNEMESPRRKDGLCLKMPTATLA